MVTEHTCVECYSVVPDNKICKLFHRVYDMSQYVTQYQITVHDTLARHLTQHHDTSSAKYHIT